MAFSCPMYGALERVAAQAGAGVHEGLREKQFQLWYPSYRLEVVLFLGTRSQPASLTVSACFNAPLDLGLGVQSGATDVWGHFAPSFGVHADEPGRARALITEPVQAALMHALGYTETVEDRPRVTLNDAGLTILTLPSAQEQLPYGPDGYLTYLMNAVSEGTKAVQVAAANVPSPASLAGLAGQMALVGQDTGMRFTSAPLGLAGRRMGVGCSARTERRAALDYALLVEASFPEPLGLGLSLGDCMEGPAFLTELYYSRPRFTTGDAAFDARFDVRVHDQRRAQTAFSPAARRELLQLRELGPFGADDTGLTLRLAASSASGASVLGALAEVSDAAGTMLGRSLPGEGPAYR